MKNSVFEPAPGVAGAKRSPPQTVDRDRAAAGSAELALPADSNAAWTVIDLADFQNVAGPAAQPKNALSVTDYGADPSGARDSADAFDRAIQVAKAQHKVVWIPAGTFQVDRHVVVDDVTVQGAGSCGRSSRATRWR